MDLGRLESILARMESIAASNDDRWLEAESMLSAHRVLIEQMYANAFLGNIEGFDVFMDGLLRQTRTSATVSQPIDAESKMERQVRLATHLERIAASIRLRLQQGVSDK